MSLFDGITHKSATNDLKSFLEKKHAHRHYSGEKMGETIWSPIFIKDEGKSLIISYQNLSNASSHRDNETNDEPNYREYSKTETYKTKADELTDILIKTLPKMKKLESISLSLEYEPEDTLRKILTALPKQTARVAADNIPIFGFKQNSEDFSPITKKTFDSLALNLPNVKEIVISTPQDKAHQPEMPDTYKGPAIRFSHRVGN